MAKANLTPQKLQTNTDPEKVGTRDKQAEIVNTLLDFETPHYFARFTIVGCPPGLEILDKYEHLLIHRRLQNTIDLMSDKRLLAYSQFEIKNSRGMQLYLAVESVKRQSLNWIRDARLFEVNVFDFHCRKIFCIKRKWSFKYCFAQYFCLFFTFGYKGCGNAVDVSLPNGTKLGSVKQKMSFSSTTTFHVYNPSGKCAMVINGVVADGILDVTFPDEDDPIAMIETLMNDTEAFDFYRVTVPRHSSVSGITFFKNFLTPEQKSLLIAAAILLDYVALKPSSDYPHFCEVIPDDYQEFPLSYSKLHRDGSRELVLLSEGRRKQKAKLKTSRLRGQWGCCIWCGKLMCMCCFLGMRRNALRCISLIIASILLIALIVLLVLLFIKYVLNSKWLIH